MDNGNMKSEKRKWIRRTVAIVLFTNVLTFGITNLISFKMPNGKVLVSRKTYENIIDFEKLYTIKDKIDKYYIGEINKDKLVEGAAKGMAAALQDPYTVFMNEAEFSDFATQTGGTYVGLGLQIGAKEDKIVVISTFENSPAEKAGILKGDIIESVNDITVTAQDMEKATSMMKGKAGEEVKLSLSRQTRGTFEVKAKRAEIEMVTVKSEILENGIGYIQVSMFDEHTASNFDNALKNLTAKGMKSLVLDLRENPGGLLDQTVKMTSNFVAKGKNIVYTEDKEKNKKNYDSIGGIAEGLPLTILIDGGSASASEIFVGAIKDYGLGTLVGEKTFGKGVVQTTFYRDKDGFGDGTALKVTISKYFTPNGQNIHGIGIAPDVEVLYPQELKEKPYNRDSDPQFKKALEVAREKLK
ncbi:S41 family peptidase [Clostridium sp. UBA4548]|uniref:S41 family peptidase n=1 Tax=Clostridium sp. UBA4548 TaxID=1946361 RepID=UPI0039C87AFD